MLVGVLKMLKLSSLSTIVLAVLTKTLVEGRGCNHQSYLEKMLGIIKIEKDALDALIRIFEAADNSGELLNYDEALDYNSLDLSWENGFSDYKADFITAIFDIIDIIHFRNVGVKSAQNDLRIAFNRIRRPAGSLAICWGIRRTSGTRNRHMSSESVLLALSDSFGKMLFSQGYLVFEYGIKTHA